MAAGGDGTINEVLNGLALGVGGAALLSGRLARLPDFKIIAAGL